ncbi:tyrosine-type recombinase/integrase [Geothrix sp. SG200]|uniref:tyrosine-type recombinase/integrase n=1 Tax=Geothrix sp. SG200 TaxID=2922865 RepID=UPI001FABB212|nr:tyrosine-type recombinase/integrase [Geothrix sp. SG200]
MASIPGLKKVGPYWHFTLKVNGQRAHGSTRATDLATARKILEEKRRELLEGQHRIVSRMPTLQELFDSWLIGHKSAFSRGHLVSVECIYRRWIAPRFGSRHLDQITSTEVLKLRESQLANGCSQRYANNTIQVLTTLLNYGIRLQCIKLLPFKVSPLRIQRRPRITIPASRLTEFFDTVDAQTANPHIRALLRVMVGLGLRESEALGMRWEWIDIEARVYTPGKAKGKEARQLPIPNWLLSELQRLPITISPWIFPAADGKPHRPQFCKKVLQRVCKAMGFSRITNHRLRATFATLHAEAGTPITAIQDMLGHKNVSTTMIYVETNLLAKRKAQEVLEQRLGLA